MAAKPFVREIVLLFVGALISVSTAIATNIFNENRAKKEKNIDEKMELNDQLSKDLGRRLFWSIESFKQARDRDSLGTRQAWSKYKESHEEWNLKIYSYQSLLRYYYGEETEKEFIGSVFNPMVQYGREIEAYVRKPDQKKNKAIDSTYRQLRNTNIKFITKIYQKIEY